MQYIFILGNTPKLSLAEINSVLPNLKIIRLFDDILIADSPKELAADKLINQLGGVVKIAVLSPRLCVAAAAEQGPPPLRFPERGSKENRYKFGFSVYKLDNPLSNNTLKKIKLDFKKQGLAYKKELRAQGIRTELIESRDLALSSVIISKEKCLDIIVLVDKDNKMIYGKTLAVQPFREYGSRDYGRPNRDPRSGMLPPKVARMMVNIANGEKDKIFIDPFCGSGTILQEALLLGYKKVYGSDISEKAIADTDSNLKFLNLKNYHLTVSDARKLKINNISTLVSEVYLGPININKEKLEAVNKELMILYQETFKNIKPLLTPNAKLVIAFPAWRFNQQIIHLPIQPVLEKMGYKILAEPIIYGRPDARVLREIYSLSV